MKKQILRLSLTLMCAMLLSLSVKAHKGMNFGIELQATEESEMETTAWQIINHGIYEEGGEAPVISPEEEKDMWINEKTGAVSWKVEIEGTLSNVQTVEFFREGEVPEVLEIKNKYEIPIEDFEYTGNYHLVVTDLEGNVSEVVQQVKVDRNAPVLKNFLVEADDLEIKVVIEEHSEHFQKDAVLLEYSVDGTVWETLKMTNEWKVSECEHTMICTFDGEEQEEETYQFRVSYTDRANNPMVLAKECAKKVRETEGGTYISLQKVFIDRKAPQLTQIQFNAPVQMFDGETAEFQGKVTDTITSEKTKLYYDKNATIRFCLEDAFLCSSNVEIRLYMRGQKNAEWEPWKEKIEIMEQETETGGEFQFTLPDQDGEYYVTISYTDLAGNLLVYAPQITGKNSGEAYPGGIREGVYQTPIFVKDSVAPAYTIFCEKEPQKYNSVEKIKTVLTMTEKNLDLDKLSVSVTAEDINGNPVALKAADHYTYDAETQRLYIEVSTEAYYHIEVKMVDKVKKTAEYEVFYCIDRSAPEITIVTKDGHEFTNAVNISSGVLEDKESDVVYSVINDGWFARILNKMTFGYFAQEKIVVRVKVHDSISGVKSFHPTCISEGKEIEDYRVSEKKPAAGDKSAVVYEIELPPAFKGTVRMHSADYAGNKGRDAGGIGMIAETEEQHKKNAKTNIEVLTPFDKTPNYYAGDVKIRFSAEDKVSGFYQIHYHAGEFQENVIYPAGEELRQEAVRTHTITENKNNVKTNLEFLDNAGYLEIFPKEKVPVIHIDKTKPIIDVAYDNVDVKNEKYYSGERTATITITERNFDPDDTIVDISGPAVQLSSWKHVGAAGCEGGSENASTHHVDACKWVAAAHFFQDGEYTLNCKTTDLAGNEASFGYTDAFVIDRTKPEIIVTYDNQSAQNGNYYNASRNAVIEISEHNFAESDVKITLRAEDSGEKIPAPKLSGWSKEGDVYRAQIAFDYDGEFFFDISYTDLAGNIADDYPADVFIVDFTAPQIEFYDIQNQSSNNDVVAPGIRCTDAHYDLKGMSFELSGSKKGLIKMPGTRTILENGVELKMRDFERMPEMDDIYTLQVTGSDLAGNISEETIRFSVNRFGSVYTFDEKTEALVGTNGSYYTNQAHDLVIHETNVDTLEFQEIMLNCNGKLKTLANGTDYQVFESGNHENWKQYTYRIEAKNFAEEGIYMLTIYSEDRAKNISDNHSKGEKIEFAVDKTSPSVLITGVENQKQYRENHREVIVDVEDNIAVGYLEVMINGEITRYDPMNIAEVDGKIMFSVKNSNDWQTMKIIAHDAAGNETKTEELKFLITANLFVQFYRNQTLLYGSIGVVVMVGGLFLIFVVKKKRTVISS